MAEAQAQACQAQTYVAALVAQAHQGARERAALVGECAVKEVESSRKEESFFLKKRRFDEGRFDEDRYGKGRDEEGRYGKGHYGGDKGVSATAAPRRPRAAAHAGTRSH